MSWLLRFLADSIAAIFAAILRDQRADQNAKDLGAAQGAAKTDAIIKEIADAQAANNAEFRDLASVVERLRKQSTTGSADSNS